MSGSPPAVRPTPAKATLSLLLGVVVGVALSAPAVPSTLDRLGAGATVGTAGIVIGGSVLALAVVMLGLMTLLRSAY